MSLPRWVDRQFVSSFLLTIVFYATLLTVLVSASWRLGNWAAVAFFGFLLWAYRWAIGEKLGLCSRRPGARPPEPAGSPDDAASSDDGVSVS
jgi:hypothetical protein